MAAASGASLAAPGSPPGFEFGCGGALRDGQLGRFDLDGNRVGVVLHVHDEGAAEAGGHLPQVRAGAASPILHSGDVDLPAVGVVDGDRWRGGPGSAGCADGANNAALSVGH